MFAESAAPVAKIIASVTAGDAKLSRDKAPSTTVVCTLNCFILSISFLTPAVSAGPDKMTFPSESARAVINLPNAVLFSLTSKISETSFF